MIRLRNIFTLAVLTVLLAAPATLVFAQGTFGGGLQDTPAGGECLATDDCKSGLSCVIPAGSGAGTCGTSVSATNNNTGTILTGTNNNPTAAPVTTGGVALLNPLNASSLQVLLQEILSNFIVPLGSILLTVMIIYTGFLFVAARGNSEKLSQARATLLWTVVGGILLLGATALATVITTTAQSL